MANTTNYNWATPDDTDLVKDGAAAIRTLGSSIDTTTKNLNPQTTTGAIAYRSATSNVNTSLPIGTANQVLRVNSGGTAPEWATTADQTPLTTKGDLFGFDTADARIPIGTNGHVLTADSTQSLGLKWASPSGSSFKGCYLYLTSDITLSNNTTTELTFGQESFDTDAFHSTSTNTGRITIPAGLGGYYRFTARGLLVGYTGNSVTPWQIFIYKNGSLTGGAFDSVYAVNNNETWVCEINHIMNLTAGDYITALVYQKSGANRTVEGVNIHGTSFMAEYLGA